MTHLNLFPIEKVKRPSKFTNRTRLFTGFSCNYDCKFCFYKGCEEINQGIIEKQIQMFKKYGVKDIDLSGGEPTILPKWFDLLAELKKSFRNICVITNCSKTSDFDFLKKSVERGLNEILLSIHGTKRVHDRMTRKDGSWKKTIDTLENAERLEIKTKINTVVTKDNYKILPEIIKMVNNYNIKNYNFIPFRIHKEGKDSLDNCIDFTSISPYISQSIDMLNSGIIPRIRYMPYCVIKDKAKYVTSFISRLVDENEWSVYLQNIVEKIIKESTKEEINTKDKWENEIYALKNISSEATIYKFSCAKCKYFLICGGFWKTYYEIWGDGEFKPVPGERIDVLN